MAAVGSAFASALSAVTTTAAQEAAARLLENEPGTYDLVIAGGRCVDPETGLDARHHASRQVFSYTVDRSLPSRSSADCGEATGT